MLANLPDHPHDFETTVPNGSIDFSYAPFSNSENILSCIVFDFEKDRHDKGELLRRVGILARGGELS